MTSLKKVSADLLKWLQDWPEQSNEAHATLSRIHALLINLQPKVNGPERELLRRMLAKLDDTPRWKFWSRPANRSYQKEEIWEIYNSLQGIMESLDQILKDTKWA